MKDLLDLPGLRVLNKDQQQIIVGGGGCHHCLPAYCLAGACTHPV